MLLALGQANGKVVLTTFGPSAYDALGLTGLELSEYLSNVFFLSLFGPLASVARCVGIILAFARRMSRVQFLGGTQRRSSVARFYGAHSALLGK